MVSHSLIRFLSVQLLRPYFPIILRSCLQKLLTVFVKPSKGAVSGSASAGSLPFVVWAHFLFLCTSSGSGLHDMWRPWTFPFMQSVTRVSAGSPAARLRFSLWCS